MAARRIDPAAGSAAVAAWTASQVPGASPPAGPAGAGMPVDRATLALAVRYTLQALADAVPGRCVEVRVPPYGVVQCIEGPRHTRGTPPNVVETDAATWLALATGGTTWGAATAGGLVRASGQRANLSANLPLRAAVAGPADVG